MLNYLTSAGRFLLELQQFNCIVVLTLYYVVSTIIDERNEGCRNMGVLQVRVDDELKNQATAIFEEMGMDLSTAVRMFLKKSVQEKGLPFETKLDATGQRMHEIVREFQKHSEEIGTSEMTLDEINEIIRLAREERRRKESK